VPATPCLPDIGSDRAGPARTIALSGPTTFRRSNQRNRRVDWQRVFDDMFRRPRLPPVQPRMRTATGGVVAISNDPGPDRSDDSSLDPGWWCTQYC